MQRTTTGNRLACFFVAAAVLACSATVAQETEDATLSAPTLSGQISTNDTGPVDPLAGFDLEAEILSLALPGAPATALLSRSRRGEARGTLLLLPGDRRPYAGSATEQLYRLLPEHQWQVVLISLARLPSSHSGQLFAAKATAAANDAGPVNGDAEGTEESSSGDASGEPQNYSQWSDDGQRRIAAALTTLEARGINSLWLVGEGYGAQLAARFLADEGSTTVLGVIFINPRVPPSLDTWWPSDPALPALDVLDPRMGRHIALQRRRQAADRLSENYRQMRIAQAVQPRFQQDSLVSRHLRGWLDRQIKSG